MSVRRKLVVAGEHGVGKTCLLMGFVHGYEPEYYVDIPTIMDLTDVHVEVEGKPMALTLWDVHDDGHNMSRRLRPLIYMESHVFLLCFSIESPDSFKRVSAIWLSEIKRLSPLTPILLIGCKKDLRENGKHAGSSVKQFISCEQGKQAALAMGLCEYLECSTKNGEGMREVLLRASEIAYHHVFPQHARRRRSGCIIM